ncbi:hypothetical protein LEP1GSC024_4762 [Leptospira noguchii str. 2001034031]|uniref:Uncharacterized protein n=1 Tax=Leptospira noguchii str. 2001034031 TaxID=1193053 RepID=M6Y4H0_9LEPT|nr:hypothetical protein LEP1GSC024_4762 [Leptospira noguchii str. 2001034031]
MKYIAIPTMKFSTTLIFFKFKKRLLLVESDSTQNDITE